MRAMPGVESPILYWPLLLLGAYLLGAIPFAQVLAKLNGVDLRKTGTGNVGAGNLSRNVGWAWGTAAAILDGLKGLLPVWLAMRSGLGPGASGVAGVAAVVGHNWSIFMRGRSGRGLATAAGMVVALNLPLVVWTGGWSLGGLEDRKWFGGIPGMGPATRGECCVGATRHRKSCCFAVIYRFDRQTDAGELGGRHESSCDDEAGDI